MLAGSFALAYLLGLVAFSGFSDQTGLTLESLLAAVSACIAVIMTALIAMDSPQPGKRLLSRLLDGGVVVERVGAVALFCLWTAVALTMIHWNDEVSNVQAARYLLQNGFKDYFHDYDRVNDWLGPHHPPLLPLIYAGIYSLFGAKIFVGRLFGISCALLACGLGYVWVKRQVGRRYALVTAALCMSYPLVWFNGASSILDPPFWLIFTACLVLFDRYMSSGKALDALWCGLCIGVAVLSRYNGFLLPPIFALLLFVDGKKRRAYKRAGAWLVLISPALLLLPWFAYAAWTGSLWTQIHRIAGFVLVAVIPEGGFFYIRNFLVPLLPFMVGLWNLPLWIGATVNILKKDGGAGGLQIAAVGAAYVLFVTMTLPNPRYLLAVAPSLAFPLAHKVLEIENREGRGFTLLLFLLGLCAVHVIFVIHQTSFGEVYFFY